MRVKQVLKDLLGELSSQVRDISLDFIRNGYNESEIKNSFKYLLGLGIKRKRIAGNAALLSFKTQILQDRYDYLRRLQIAPKNISIHAHLLGRDQQTMQHNYDNLRRLQITPKSISTYAQLLGLNPETIQHMQS
ncbi:hypothetical protein LCGC14_2634720 [marine sediment metagenome]|uniref:Uncharacterized protein n=1 Tax=marine sediment metagenome TaxID=412755 RepID=A0A0F9CRK7_9ZZZZ